MVKTRPFKALTEDGLSMLENMVPLQILGTGHYLPDHVVFSSEFDTRWHKPDGWTWRHVGVERRHVASLTESSSTMGARAAVRALDAAQIHPEEIDCIVSACSVMEQAIPCLASQIQRQLGLGESGIPAFDVNATCLSFVVALDLMSAAIALGRYKKVLIVSSELPTAGLNPDDHGTAALFGDGAAAVVVGATPQGDSSGLLAAHMSTFGVGGAHCQVRAGGTRFRAEMGFEAYRTASSFEMDGRAIYRLAARHFPAFLEQLLAKARIGVHDLSCIVPHQASGKALDHLVSSLGLPANKIVRIIQHCGNQVAASIPSVLHHAISSQALRRGQLVALLGTGAGVSLGGVVLRY